jgi:hypothetical protein
MPITKNTIAGIAKPATAIHSRVGLWASPVSRPIRAAQAASTNAPPRYENASTIESGGPKNDETRPARVAGAASASASGPRRSVSAARSCSAVA